jgi:CBS domain-containing protein
MKVAQVMTPAPLACGPATNLAEIAALMWDANCGIVPIVDQAGRVVRVVTDRDVCIAAATLDRPPSAILASELPHRPAICCRPEDDVRAALESMKDYRIRRLPVTNDDGVLHGIVSIDDILLEAGGAYGDVAASDVLATLQAVCARRLPQTRIGHTA